MRKLSLYITLTIFGVLLPLLMGSCSDDFFNFRNDGNDATVLNILVPSATMARESGATRGAAMSRADHHGQANLLTAEAKIHTLRLFAFYYPDGKENELQHFSVDLTDFDGTPVDNIYYSYKLDVAPGVYDIYLIANVAFGDEVLAQFESDATDAAALKDYIEKLALPDVPKLANGLPMYSHTHTEVKQKQETQVSANMKFACAKVRLSVLYDATDGGFSVPAFGKNTPLEFTSLTAYNVYNQPKLFVDDAADGSGMTASKLASLSIWSNAAQDTPYSTTGHYALPAGHDYGTDSGYAALCKIPESGTDPLDAFMENPTIVPSTAFAFQSVMYLPECVNKSESDATYLSLAGQAGGSAIDPYKIMLGCGSSAENGYHGPGIVRGNFYDLIARISQGGEVTFTWKVTDWSAENTNIYLAGMNMLDLPVTEIEHLDGETSVKIPYNTNAPTLTFISDEMEVGGKSVKCFLLSQKPDEKNIEVKVNPALGQSDVLITGKGFYVQAGNIKKYVKVKQIDIKAYLTLTPETQTVYISNVVNEPTYPMFVEYSTNINGLTITLSKYQNPNTQSDSRLYVEICDINDNGDYYAISEKAGLTANMSLLDLTAKPGMEISPNHGFLRITIDDPSQQSFFGKTINGTFTAQAGSESETAVFEIIPNASVYTIHFRTADNSWGDPHVYVYQPLEYNGYQVYGDNGSYNHLEYIFTGQVSFAGWKENGGPDVNTPPTKVETFNQAANQPVTGYKLTLGGDPGYDDNLKSPYYDTDSYLLPNTFRPTKCTTCQGWVDNKRMGRKTWPGVGMQDEGNGWWRIQLPKLAVPNKALVMFSNGHYGNNGRYPDNGVPGVVLPNFADSEAWFVYGENDNKFVDDMPSKYQAPTDYESKSYKIAFRWPFALGVENKQYTKFYIWKESQGSDKVEYAGAFSGVKATHSGDYYVCTLSLTKSQYEDLKSGSNSDVKFIFYDNSGRYNYKTDSYIFPDRDDNDACVPYTSPYVREWTSGLPEDADCGFTLIKEVGSTQSTIYPAKMIIRLWENPGSDYQITGTTLSDGKYQFTIPTTSASTSNDHYSTSKDKDMYFRFKSATADTDHKYYVSTTLNTSVSSGNTYTLNEVNNVNNEYNFILPKKQNINGDITIRLDLTKSSNQMSISYTVETVETEDYYIIGWNKTNWEYIYLWSGSSQPAGNWPGTKFGKSYSNYNYAWIKASEFNNSLSTSSNYSIILNNSTPKDDQKEFNKVSSDLVITPTEVYNEFKSKVPNGHIKAAFHIDY